MSQGLMTAFDKQLWVSVVDVAVMPFVGCGFGERECCVLVTPVGEEPNLTPSPAVLLRSQVRIATLFFDPVA
jgi:hypothetical protein